MGLSEEEKAKFMSMVDDDDMYNANGKYFIEDRSKVSHAEILIDDESKELKTLWYACNNNNGEYPIALNCDSGSFDFIVSIINKISPNMRIIYSSDTSVVYSSEHIDVKGVEFSVVAFAKRKSWISLPRRSYCLYEHGAVVCDEILEQLCSDDNTKHDLLKAYVSHPEAFSKEMRDKIKPIYDVLPPGEKLLLELGEDI